MKKIILLLANGFGLGNSPHCSGTIGALAGIPFAIALTALYDHPWVQVFLSYVLFMLAFPICDYAEKHYQTKDDSRIVADEWMLLPICFIAQEPIWRELTEGDWLTAVAFTGMAFVVSRIADILKPFPAFQLQSMKGGIGIVLDDFFANLYAWCAIFFLNRFLLHPVLIPFARRLFGME